MSIFAHSLNGNACGGLEYPIYEIFVFIIHADRLFFLRA